MVEKISSNEKLGNCFPHRFDIWTSAELHITAVIFQSDQPVLITFSPAAPTREPFGGSLLRRHKINHIAVTCSAPEWWQYANIDEAGAALRAAVQNFSRVVHYGSSMGAFGALFFSGMVQPHCVLAFAPQFSIAPTEPPFETRWAANYPRIDARGGFLKSGMGDRLMRTGEIIVAYDPLNPDAQHVALLEETRPIRKLVVPFGGHGLLFALAQMGLASRFVTDIVTASPDIHVWRKMVRASRHKSIDYMRNVTGVLKKRGSAGVLQTIARAIDHLPEDEASQAGQLMTVALELGDSKLAARCFLAQLDAAIIDGGAGLAMRMRQYAPLLGDAGLTEATLSCLSCWIEDDKVPSARTLAKAFNTLRRNAPSDPLGSPRVRSAIRMLKWSGTPDTVILAMLCKAILLWASGQKTEATALLSETSGLVGGWHPFNLELARTWDAFGNLDQAVNHARRVVVREPANDQAIMFLAMKLETAGRIPEAIQVYQECFLKTPRIKPGWVTSGLALARCLRRDNKIDQAVLTIDTILAVKSDSAPAWKLKATCLNDMAQYEGALDACRKALALSREDDSLKRLIVKLEARV